MAADWSGRWEEGNWSGRWKERDWNEERDSNQERDWKRDWKDRKQRLITEGDWPAVGSQANFSRPTLGCIEAGFWNQILIGKGLAGSIRSSFLCNSPSFKTSAAFESSSHFV